MMRARLTQIARLVTASMLDDVSSRNLKALTNPMRLSPAQHTDIMVVSAIYASMWSSPLLGEGTSGKHQQQQFGGELNQRMIGEHPCTCLTQIPLVNSPLASNWKPRSKRFWIARSFAGNNCSTWSRFHFYFGKRLGYGHMIGNKNNNDSL